MAYRPLLMISMLAATSLGFGDDSKKAVHQKIEALGFLAGTWRGPMWGGEFEAYYSTPEGGRVIGYSLLLRGERIAFYEFELFQVDDGRSRPPADPDAPTPEPHVTLLPHPGGKPAVPLHLTRIDAVERKAVFENPGKDYPTRIVYQRVADDRLVITLDDPHGGGDKVEVFDLRRSGE